MYRVVVAGKTHVPKPCPIPPALTFAPPSPTPLTQAASECSFGYVGEDGTVVGLDDVCDNDE